MLPELSEESKDQAASVDEPGAQAPPQLTLEQKQQNRARLNLNDKVTDIQLEEENWDVQFIEASQTDLKKVAKGLRDKHQWLQGRGRSSHCRMVRR